MSSYCDSAPGHQFHGPYHATEYGFPVSDEAVLFERLTLEIFQAGLSWLIVLKKREGFKIAFENFNVDRVAGFGDRIRYDYSRVGMRLSTRANSCVLSQGNFSITASAALSHCPHLDARGDMR